MRVSRKWAWFSEIRKTDPNLFLSSGRIFSQQLRFLMKLMLVAGEASGDAHGRELLKELNILIPELETFGIGGKGLLGMGLRPYFMLDTMQSHGITELLFHLPRLYRTLHLMKEALESEKPDALVLIDYPGFNLKLAAQAKKLGIPVIFFSSPQIWVWRSGRIKKIKNIKNLKKVTFSEHRQND